MRLAVICLLAAPLMAQTSAPAGDPASQAEPGGEREGYPLREIQVDGNSQYQTGDIIALTDLRIGQRVTVDDFKTALDAINSAGVFEALEFRYGPKDGGYAVTFNVQEIRDLYPVRVQGFDLPDEEIQQLLREKVPLFGPRVPPTGPVIERIGDTLQQLWTSLGNDTEVVGRLAPAGDGFEMLFQPRGDLRTIAFTRFEGGAVVPNDELQRTFQTIAMGEIYTQERLLELLRHNVGPLYEAKGYLEVSYCPCTTESDADTKGLVVTIPVEEGAQYHFGEIKLTLESGLAAEPYAALLKFETGEVAEWTKVTASQEAIEAVLKREGYMNAEIREERVLHRDSKTADVALIISSGDQFTFNRLVVEGLDVISESGLRKRWGIQVGEPFDASYPAFFLDRIREEGMFDNLQDTAWSLQVNGTERTVDVTLTLR